MNDGQLLAGTEALLKETKLDEQNAVENSSQRSGAKFHPEKIPPNFDEAVFHQQCARFGFEDPDSTEVCPCCNNTRKTESKTEQNTAQVATCPTIPQYFAFSIFLTMFCVMAAFLAFPFWILEGFRGGVLSLTKQNLDHTGKWVLFFYCFFLYLLSGWCFGRLPKPQKQAEQSMSSLLRKRKGVSSVMICDLNEGSELQKEYLEGFILSRLKEPTRTTRIIGIAIFKFENHLIHIERTLEKTLSSLEGINITVNSEMTDPQVNACVRQQQNSLKKQADELVAKWDKYCRIQNDKTSAVHKHNVAIVALGSQEQAANVQKSTTSEFIKYLLSSCCQKKGSYHNVYHAPEPNDFKWENVGVSSVGRFGRIVGTNFFFLALYVASFTIQISGIVIENRWFKKLNDETSDDSFLGYILSLKLLSGLIVQTTNSLFSAAMSYVIYLQSPLSHTEANLSHTRKLIFVQCFNTLATTVVLSFINHRESSLKDLFQKLSGQLVSNFVVSILLTIFPPKDIYRKYKIWSKVTRRVRDNKPILMTQEELNKLMELPDFNIPLRYTTMVRGFLLTCFCASVVPFGFWLCIVSLLKLCKHDQDSLIQNSKVTLRMHESFSVGIFNIIKLGGLLALCGNLIFSIRADLELSKGWEEIKLLYTSFIVQVVVLCLAFISQLLSAHDPGSLSDVSDDKEIQETTEIEDSRMLTSDPELRLSMHKPQTMTEGVQSGSLGNQDKDHLDRPIPSGAHLAQPVPNLIDAAYLPARLMTEKEFDDKHAQRLQQLLGLCRKLPH